MIDRSQQPPQQLPRGLLRRPAPAKRPLNASPAPTAALHAADHRAYAGSTFGTQEVKSVLLATLSSPEGLSIVLQGALLHSDAARLASYIESWRRLFPHAQIICAISSSDCLADPPAAGMPIIGLRPAPGLVEDAELAASLRAISTVADVIVNAREESPLPPIKSDSPGPNNTNLMIAAAHAGLSWARGSYTLRIRNDLLLTDPSFVSIYAAGLNLPRGAWSVFAQRIMVAEVFTLNPLTLSHMPFHYSDWFHFGLTSDIRRLWQPIRPMTVEDANFYESHAHLPESNNVERRFRSRLAPEQMVSFPIFREHFPKLRLDHHNDLTSVEESLLVLADNFVVASLAECRARIDKYQHIVDRMSTYTRLECMSQALIRKRARHPEVPACLLFADAIRRTARFEWWPNRYVRIVRRALTRWLSSLWSPR